MRETHNLRGVALLKCAFLGHRELLFVEASDKTIAPVFVRHLRHSTVCELKVVIEERQGIPVSKQRLYFAGKQLEDCRELSAFDILPLSTLHAFRLRTFLSRRVDVNVCA